MAKISKRACRRELVRVVEVEGVASRKVLESMGMFSLAVSRGGAGGARRVTFGTRATRGARVAKAAIERITKRATELAMGERSGARTDATDAPAIVLICGASGSGKSTVLRRVDAGLSARGSTRVIRVQPWRVSARLRSRMVIDAVPGDGADARAMLAAAGLADAMLYARRVKHLSDGQRHRLLLAWALASSLFTHHGRETVVLMDEFASGLDAATAYSLCRTLPRAVAWARGRGARVSVVVATSDARVCEWLAHAARAECVWMGTRGIAVRVVEGGGAGGEARREEPVPCVA